jgi:hypothetical protein
MWNALIKKNWVDNKRSNPLLYSYSLENDDFKKYIMDSHVKSINNKMAIIKNKDIYPLIYSFNNSLLNYKENTNVSLFLFIMSISTSFTFLLWCRYLYFIYK